MTTGTGKPVRLVTGQLADTSLSVLHQLCTRRCADNSGNSMYMTAGLGLVLGFTAENVQKLQLSVFVTDRSVPGKRRFPTELWTLCLRDTSPFGQFAPSSLTGHFAY